jgi:hypothetical protein
MATLKPKVRRDPPTMEEVTGALFAPEPGTAEPVEKPKAKVGRPKGTISRERQLATKIKADVYHDMKRIAARDRISLAELIERSVARYEEHRLARAGEIDNRKPGESADAFISRAFKLDVW